MRAAMKLATGVVPVALGVAMALVSGMAKAEDNVEQPQPLTGAVSAKTILPSVGHRPAKHTGHFGIARQYGHPDGGRSYAWGFTDTTSGVRTRVGKGLYPVNLGNNYPEDKDNQFGAQEKEYSGRVNFACDIYRDGNLVAQKEPCIEKGNGSGGDRLIYIFKPEDVGKMVKIVFWRYTRPESAAGYTVVPRDSLPREITVGPVEPGYSSDLSSLQLVRQGQSNIEFTLSARSNDGSILEEHSSIEAQVNIVPSLPLYTSSSESLWMQPDGTRKARYSMSPSSWPQIATNYTATITFEGRPVFRQLFTLNPDKTITLSTQTKYPYCTLGSNNGQIGQVCND